VAASVSVSGPNSTLLKARTPRSDSLYIRPPDDLTGEFRKECSIGEQGGVFVNASAPAGN
jgi:hypothetical protein